MSRDSHVDDPLAFVGDGRWWERGDCFTHPQARMFVPNLDDVIVELRHLFPADVCIELVRQGHGECVIGLFLGAGWTDRVDALLQLGSDLSHCLSWRDDKKLLRDLRSPDAREAARFEVGIWAGLHRVGLVPEREPAIDRGHKRADFRVRDGVHRVALELKSLADPQRARNLHALYACLWKLASPFWSDSVGSIGLLPSPELEELLDGTAEAFHGGLDATIWPAMLAFLRHGIDVGQYHVCGVGVIAIRPRDPSWEPSMAGQPYIAGNDEWSLEKAASRVIMRAGGKAGPQLEATDADLRSVIVWGSLDQLPCESVADEIVRQISVGARTPGVDYIGIVNCHRRGPRPGWTTDAAVRAVREGWPLPETMTWPRALTAWGLLHRACAVS